MLVYLFIHPLVYYNENRVFLILKIKTKIKVKQNKEEI